MPYPGLVIQCSQFSIVNHLYNYLLPLCSILKIRTSTLIRRGRDSTGRQDAYATSEDMKMASVEVKPNTAYEAVCTRHQARPSGRLQETVIDEPVYDIPEP